MDWEAWGTRSSDSYNELIVGNRDKKNNARHLSYHPIERCSAGYPGWRPAFHLRHQVLRVESVGHDRATARQERHQHAHGESMTVIERHQIEAPVLRSKFVPGHHLFNACQEIEMGYGYDLASACRAGCSQQNGVRVQANVR